MNASTPAAVGAAPMVRIGRQGIFNAQGRLLGHELLFRGTAESSEPVRAEGERIGRAEDEATSHVIAMTFGDFGVQELGAGLPLYINMTRAFLLGELPLPFGPDKVVLEVLENITVDDELLAALTRLRDQGYVLAVDDFTGEPERLPLLPLAGVVKLDLLSLTGSLTELVELVREHAPQATILAERVEDEDVVTRCVELGIDAFQGYYFERPAVLETIRLTPSQMVCLRLMQALADQESDIDRLQDIVALDPGLSLRVLRTANSVMVSAPQRITSLRHALGLLGSRMLGAWVALTMLGGASREPRDDLVDILTQAAFCEQLAVERDVDPSTAYTAGMMFGVARALRVRLECVATPQLVGPELSAAVLSGEGPAGEVVTAVMAFDAGAHNPGLLLGLAPLEMSQHYLDAWTWAQRTLAAMTY